MGYAGLGPRMGFHLLLPVYLLSVTLSNLESTCDTLYLDCFPHLDSMIVACRGDTFIIAGPTYGMHRERMTAVGKDMVSVGGVQNMHCVVTTAGSDALGIVRR